MSASILASRLRTKTEKVDVVFDEFKGKISHMLGHPGYVRLFEQHSPYIKYALRTISVPTQPQPHDLPGVSRPRLFALKDLAALEGEVDAYVRRIQSHFQMHPPHVGVPYTTYPQVDHAQVRLQPYDPNLGQIERFAFAVSLIRLQQCLAQPPGQTTFTYLTFMGYAQATDQDGPVDKIRNAASASWSTLPPMEQVGILSELDRLAEYLATLPPTHSRQQALGTALYQQPAAYGYALSAQYSPAHITQRKRSLYYEEA